VPRPLTVAVDGDNQHHSQLFRSVCTFLWMYWAKDVASDPDRSDKFNVAESSACFRDRAGWK
jgi:hypothetical protein